MQICEIGNSFNMVERINYLSNRTFIDFDAIILDFHSILVEYHSQKKREYDRRKSNLSEFLQHKEIPLIILAPQPQNIYFDHQQYELASLLPIFPFSVKKETGKKINILSNTIFTDFLLKYQEYFSYDSHFEDFKGKVIAETPHTKKVLAFYNKTSIFLLQIKADIKNVEDKFLLELIEIAKKIIQDQKKQPLPDWVHKYFLPDEKPISEEISKIKQNVSILENSLQKKEIEIEKYLDKKLLYTGTGDHLEIEIENIFRELRCEILESDRDRDDLIIKHTDKIAVIEIKGVTGSAAEKNSAQLEKWKILYNEKNEIEPKGILIINSYRDKELKDRTEATFPHQMLKYAENREHCLISSLQLLGLYYDAIQNNKQEELINSLFKTIGVYKGYENWKNFIDE